MATELAGGQRSDGMNDDAHKTTSGSCWRAASGQLRWDLGLPDATDEQPRSAGACQAVEKSYCEPKNVSSILTIGSTLNGPYNKRDSEMI
jgi:hypothetical protein